MTTDIPAPHPDRAEQTQPGGYRGPHVSRSATAVWSMTERWGAEIGDIRRWSVRRSGQHVHISDGRREISVRLDAARQHRGPSTAQFLAESLAAAIAWEDTP